MFKDVVRYIWKVSPKQIIADMREYKQCLKREQLARMHVQQIEKYITKNIGVIGTSRDLKNMPNVSGCIKEYSVILDSVPTAIDLTPSDIGVFQSYCPRFNRTIPVDKCGELDCCHYRAYKNWYDAQHRYIQATQTRKNFWHATFRAARTK